jgi:hypothetical protein
MKTGVPSGNGNMMRMYDVYDIPQIVRMKEQFRLWFKGQVKLERINCSKLGIVPQMTPEKMHEVDGILDRHCGTPYHIEGLRRMLHLYNRIPTIMELDAYAQALKEEAWGKVRAPIRVV